METLPTKLTPALLEFCHSISPERPRLIRSKPLRDSLQSQCFDNVAKKVARAGGTTVYGWAVWHLRGAYFEAEHHGVWGKRDGQLLDVSPQFNDCRKILFLPDPDAIYDPGEFRSNRFAPDGDDPRALEIVKLLKERGALLDSCRATGASAPDFATQGAADRLLVSVQSILNGMGGEVG